MWLGVVLVCSTVIAILYVKPSHMVALPEKLKQL